MNDWPHWHLQAQEPSCCPSPAQGGREEGKLLTSRPTREQSYQPHLCRLPALPSHLPGGAFSFLVNCFVHLVQQWAHGRLSVRPCASLAAQFCDKTLRSGLRRSRSIFFFHLSPVAYLSLILLIFKMSMRIMSDPAISQGGSLIYKDSNVE